MYLGRVFSLYCWCFVTLTLDSWNHTSGPLSKTCLRPYSGIEPCPCDVFLGIWTYKIWTTFFLTKVTFCPKMTHGYLICSAPRCVCYFSFVAFYRTRIFLTGLDLIKEDTHPFWHFFTKTGRYKSSILSTPKEAFLWGNMHFYLFWALRPILTHAKGSLVEKGTFY